VFFLVVLLGVAPQPVDAAIVTWDGGGDDGTCSGAGTGDNWSCGLNWSTDSVPTAADVATFSSTADAVDIDSAVSVLGVNITSGFTGVITQNASVTVGTSDWIQAGGTFTGGAFTMDLNDAFTLTGGTFTAPSGTTTHAGAFTHTTSTGTFAHNSGTWTFDGTTSPTINVNSTETFNNITINKPSASATLTISTNDTLISSGTTTLTDGQVNSSVGGGIRVDGSLVHGAGFDGGTGVMRLNVAQAFSPTSGGVMPGLNLIDAGSSFTGLGVGTTTFEGPVTATPGTFNAGAGTIEFQSSLTTTPSTFSHNSGTVLFGGSGDSNLDLSGTVDFYNFTINKTAATGGVNIFGDDVAVANNAVTLTNGELDGSTSGGSVIGVLEAPTAATVASTFDGGTGQLRLTAGISLTPATGAVLPGIDLAHASSSLTGPGAATTITFEGPVETGPGTFNAGLGTVAIQRNLTVNTAGTFNHDLGTVTFSGSAISIIDVPTSLTLNNVTLNKTGAVAMSITIGDTVEVDGLLTLTDGSCGSTGTPGTGSGFLEQNGTFSYASAFDGGSCQIIFNTAQVIAVPSGRPFSGFRFNVSSSSLTLVDSHTIGGEIDLAVAGTTFTAGTGTSTLARGLSMASGATFTHNSGTIEWQDVNGVQHVIGGTLTFNNMLMQQEATSGGITFPASTTTTIDGNLQLTIGSSNPPTPIDLRSSSSGVQATIDINGTDNRLGNDLDVQDINNASSFTIFCTVRCVDGGNNSGIVFGQARATVGSISGNTTEAGGVATFDVVLDSEPSADVDIPVSSSDTSEGTVSTGTLTFTTANWDTPQTVTVTGVDDADEDGPVEFTITLGAMVSADGRYSGLSTPDVTVVNEDNDLPAFGIDLTNAAGFDREDVKDSAASPITWFEHDYYGHGLLMTASGGTEVDLIPSKIKAGCQIDIDGSVYTITRVFDDPVNWGDGYITVTDEAGTSPEEFDLILTSGNVDSILCTEVGALGHQFSSEFINATSVTPTSGVATWHLVYDPANNALWADAPVQRLDLGSLTVTEGTRGSGFETYMAFDPTRGRIWYSNENDDTVTVVTTATVATFATYATCDGPEQALYDPTNDKIWVACGDGDNLWAHNPADGSFLHATAFTADPGSFNNRGLVYDSGQDAIWAVIEDGVSAVKIDATDGSFFNGTLANSTYPIPVTDTTFVNNKSPLYDPVSDQLFFMDGQCDGGDDDYIYRFDAATGTALGEINIPSCPLDQKIDTTNRVIYVSSDHEGTFTEYRIDDGSVVRRHMGMDPSYGLAIDGENDVWITEYDINFHEYVRDGVPADNYYTMVTNDTGELDSSTWAAIDSVALNEDLDGGSIFYSVSFDDANTFEVWGSWRPIASRLASVHGGTDGVWYYRDNADAWTAAPQNTAASAISAAVAAGANNQMTGTTLSGLTDTDWATAGGFESGTTTTINLATTFFTNDAHNSPRLGSASFSVTTADITVTPTSGVTDENGSSFDFDVVLTSAPSADVTVPISSSDTTEGIVSNASLTFTSGNWSVPQTITVTGVDDAVQDGDIPYTLVTGAAVSADANYSGIDPDDITATNADDDLPPVFSGPLADQTWDEDTSLTGAFDLDDVFTDPTGDGLTYSVTAADTPRSDFIITINGDATVDFSSTENFSGADTVTFRATNAVGSADSNSLALTVNPVNDPPEPPVSGFSPGDGDQTSDTTPQISWDDAEDIDNTADELTYTLRIGTDSDPENNFDAAYTSSLGSPSVNVTDMLQTGETYFYVVRTTDPDDANSAWSEIQSFQVGGAEPEIVLTKIVGINLAAAAEPSLLLQLVGWLFGWPAFAAAGNDTMSGSLTVAIAGLFSSIAVLLGVVVYARFAMRRSRNALRFLLLRAQTSFNDIAETDRAGMVVTSFTAHKSRARVAKIVSRLALLTGLVCAAFLAFLQPSLSFENQAGQGVEPGDVLTYEVRYENTGAGDATSSTLRDTIPTGTSAVRGSFSLNGAPVSPRVSGADRTITVGTISAGESGTLRYSVVVDNPLDPNLSAIVSPGAVFNSNETSVTSNSVTNPVIAGSISGQVTDESGNPLGSIQVELLDSSGALIATGFTDSAGNYSFPGLSAGTYTVHVVAPGGFDDASQTVVLERDTDLVVNFVLVRSDEEPVPPEVVDDVISGEQPLDELDDETADEVAEEIIRRIIEGELEPDDISPELLADLLERALRLDFVNGEAVDQDNPVAVVIPIEFAESDVLLDLIGRAFPGSEVVVKLCNTELTEAYTTTASAEGGWELRVPREQLGAGLHTVVAESSFMGAMTAPIELAHFVNLTEPPNRTLWLIFINLFIVMMVALSLTFVRWWNRRGATPEERKRRRPVKIILIVLSLVAMVVLAIIIGQALLRDFPNNEVEFTSRLEVPELQVDSIDGIPVQVNNTAVLEAEDKVILRGTGTPGAELSLSVCSGIEVYAVEIDSQGNWLLELPLNEVPNQQVVYKGLLSKDGEVIVPESEFVEVKVTELLAGLPIWLLILLSVLFIIAATIFEWNLLTLFATRKKPEALPPAAPEPVPLQSPPAEPAKPLEPAKPTPTGAETPPEKEPPTPTGALGV
jgi:hypothetical protein